MRWMTSFAAFALLTVACTGARAADTSFQVSVRVLPSRPAPEAIDALPLPSGARALGAHPQGHSYHYAGTRDQAMHFYRTRMPQLGYRLVGESPATGLLWEAQGTRIEMRFQQVLGAPVATRILINAARSSHPGRDTRDAG